MKKTITIVIEDNVGVNVYYEKEGEQRKHWSECEPVESTEIFAASRVLAAGTQMTAAYVCSGMHRTIEELAGTIKHYNEIMDKANKYERRGKKKTGC
jgi:methyl coenzyme M reductase beta subunit